MAREASSDAAGGLPPGDAGRGCAPTPAPVAGLGLGGSFALVAGGMLGIGIFIAPPQMAAHVGSPAVLLALWAAGGLAALCGALCVAELGVRIPRSGGDVVYLREAFGAQGPPLAFAAGWLQLLAIFPGSIATMLDDLLDELGVEGIDFLSMDIERWEPRALAGFDIERFRPELVCIEAHGPVREELVRYFAEHGYVRIDAYLPLDPLNWYYRRKDVPPPEPLAEAT